MINWVKILDTPPPKAEDEPVLLFFPAQESQHVTWSTPRVLTCIWETRTYANDPEDGVWALFECDDDYYWPRGVPTHWAKINVPEVTQADHAEVLSKQVLTQHWKIIRTHRGTLFGAAIIHCSSAEAEALCRKIWDDNYAHIPGAGWEVRLEDLDGKTHLTLSDQGDDDGPFHSQAL